MTLDKEAKDKSTEPVKYPKPFLATINNSYRMWLSKIDSKVPEKGRRPFVVGIIKLSGYEYAIPFTSQILTSIGKMRNDKLTDYVKNDHNQIISALCYNYMIPVTAGCYSKIDVARSEKTDMIRDEAIFLRKNRASIAEKAEKVYKIRTGGLDVFFNNFCCDFKALEKECDNYEKAKIQGFYRNENQTSAPNGRTR